MRQAAVRVKAFGKEKTIPEWAIEKGVPVQNIWARLQQNWPAERAVSEPVNSSGKRLTTAEFVIRAKRVHGDRYRYGKSTYRSNKYPIVITCKEHGDFEQLPIHHFSGHGCPECGRRKKLL